MVTDKENHESQRRNPPHMLMIVKSVLGDKATLRYSKRGTPHLIYEAGPKLKVSICWFGRLKSWKTFEPWPSFDKEQTVNEWHIEGFLGMLGHLLGPGSTIEVG
jgi:hypothetical protein